MELTNEAYEAINKYFSVLEHTGYKPYNEVEKLFVFLFIEELLTGPMSEFITEEDYDIISNSLYCLYGTCMLTFPTYKEGVSHIRNNGFDNYRITEDNIARRSEDNNIRVKA